MVVKPSPGPSARDWQRDYTQTFLGAVAHAHWANSEFAHAAVVAEMKRFLPIDELHFLMELSIEPIVTQLGVTAPATRARR